MRLQRRTCFFRIIEVVMNSVVVYCGNGGDYEYERDRANWIVWIDQNISGCWRIGLWCVGFSITPHLDADKAIVKFDDPHNAVIFALKKPEYIHLDNDVFDRSLI